MVSCDNTFLPSALFSFSSRLGLNEERYSPFSTPTLPFILLPPGVHILFPCLFGARTPHAHACHISQCIHIPAATSTGFNFFFPPLYHTAFLGTSRVSSSRLLFSCFLFTVLSNIVRGSASNAMHSVSFSSFSSLVPRSSFSYLLCNTQYSFFDTVFSLCYRLASVFFFYYSCSVSGLLFYSQFEYGLCI